MLTWAYVFITSRQPKKVLRLLRRTAGVVHADALFGSPDLIAIVAGDDIAGMDAVIDRIAEIPLVAGTDSKVARWIDGVTFPPPVPSGLTGSRARRRHARGARRLAAR
jgi:phosphohistidine swiveling domain-containing protein